MICQQDGKGRSSVSSVKMEFSWWSRELLYIEFLRDAEEEGKTRIQDRTRFVYNVKMCLKKKKRKKKNCRWEIPGLLVLILG